MNPDQLYLLAKLRMAESQAEAEAERARQRAGRSRTPLREIVRAARTRTQRRFALPHAATTAAKPSPR